VKKRYKYEFETVPVYLEIVPSVDGQTFIQINKTDEDRILYAHYDNQVPRIQAINAARQKLADKIDRLIKGHEGQIKWLKELESEADTVFNEVKKEHAWSRDDT
jgi:hypothetical protein